MAKRLKDENRRWTFSVTLDGVGAGCDATVYGKINAARTAQQRLQEQYNEVYPDRDIHVSFHRKEVLSDEVVSQVRGLEAETKIVSKALDLAVQDLCTSSTGIGVYETEDLVKKRAAFVLEARKQLFPQYFKDNSATIVKEAMEIEESQLEATPSEESSEA